MPQLLLLKEIYNNSGDLIITNLISAMAMATMKMTGMDPVDTKDVDVGVDTSILPIVMDIQLSTVLSIMRISME